VWRYELSRPDRQTVFDSILEGAFCVGSASQCRVTAAAATQARQA